MTDRYLAIELRKEYGRLRAYPMDSHAKTFASLAGTTTLSGAALRLIQGALGYTVMWRAQNPKGMPAGSPVGMTDQLLEAID